MSSIQDRPVDYTATLPRQLEPGILSGMTDPVRSFVYKASLRNTIHDAAFPIVNPAAQPIADPEEANRIDGLRDKLFSENTNTRVTLQSPDGNRIDGVFIDQGKSNNTILFALGSGGRYEALADQNDAASHFLSFMKQLKEGTLNILVINPRGVGESEGSPCLHGSSLDYYTALDFLRDKGHNILAWGHSLGSRLLIPAASWMQQEHPEQQFGLVSDRSFSHLPSMMESYIGGGVKGKVVNIVARYAGLGGDVQQDFLSIKGPKLIIKAPNDPTIKEGISLSKAMDNLRIDEQAEKLTKLDLNGPSENEDIGEENPERYIHQRTYEDDEVETIKGFVNKVFS